MLAGAHEVEVGTKQALKSRTFWHIGLSLMFQFTIVGTVIVHVMPFLSSIGIPRSTASLVTMALPLVSIAGRLSSGWFGDKFNKKGIATGFLAIMVIGLLCLNYA